MSKLLRYYSEGNIYFVTSVTDKWEYSSIHDYKDKGYYQIDWGMNEDKICDGEIGE